MQEPEANAARSGPDQPGQSSLRDAGVVHDLNQMLAVIIGRAELLLRRVPGERSHLHAILLAARDAGFMLERLGDRSCGPSGTNPDSVAAVARVVDEAASRVLPPDDQQTVNGSTAAGWTLENRVAPDVGLAVPEPALREVLTNLLLNAIGAMPTGGRVVVDAGIDGDSVRLRVADNGPGLPPGAADLVFEAGFTTSGSAGRGIGLAACRQLLAGYGATLTVLPGEGSGAVFGITGPRALVVAPEGDVAGPVHGDQAASPSGLAGMEVAVIDDEAAVREMIADVLGELGCRVRCHRDGEAALAAGAPGTAAVALVDRRLPGLDGLEVAARLRERRPTLVVVLMTGWDREELPDDSATVDFSLRKPMGMDVLRDLLVRAGALHNERRMRGES